MAFHALLMFAGVPVVIPAMDMDWFDQGMS